MWNGKKYKVSDDIQYVDEKGSSAANLAIRCSFTQIKGVTVKQGEWGGVSVIIQSFEAKLGGARHTDYTKSSQFSKSKYTLIKKFLHRPEYNKYEFENHN